MSWNHRSLGTLLEKSGSDRAGKHDYPVLSITMKHGLVDQSVKFKKRIASQDTTKYRVAYKNELVVGFPIDEGVLGFQTKYSAGIVSPAYNIWQLKDKSETHIPYLERYLRSPQARRLYASKMQGAVARRRSLTKSDFLKLQIPFPPLDDQIHIAHLLSKVEGLIAQRKQNLHQLDDLLKSVFLEMFGAPVRNEKGWEHKPCNKVVINIQSGTSYGGEEKEDLENDEYGVLKISSVTPGWFNSTEFKAVKKSVINKPLKFVQQGDFLFSRANTIELVAACCIVEGDHPNLFIPDKLWLLSFAEVVTPQYFNFLLKNESFRNLVRKKASGGHDSMLNISMKKFRSLSIPVPPLKLQNQFATIVEKVESVKFQYQKSLTELDNLYGALSQKAFKGELDLSNVPIHHEIEVHDIVQAQDVVSPTLVVEEDQKLEFTLERFQQIISQELLAKFTFEDLRNAIGDNDFDFNKIKEFMGKCLQGAKPFLTQGFESQKDRHADVKEDMKRITFQVNR